MNSKKSIISHHRSSPWYYSIFSLLISHSLSLAWHIFTFSSSFHPPPSNDSYICISTCHSCAFCIHAISSQYFSLSIHSHDEKHFSYNIFMCSTFNPCCWWDCLHESAVLWIYEYIHGDMCCLLSNVVGCRLQKCGWGGSDGDSMMASGAVWAWRFTKETKHDERERSTMRWTRC